MEPCVSCRQPFDMEKGHFSYLTPCGIHLGVCSHECWWKLAETCAVTSKKHKCPVEFEVEDNRAVCNVIGYPAKKEIGGCATSTAAASGACL